MKKILYLLAIIPSIVFANIQLKDKDKDSVKDPEWENIKAPYYGSWAGSAVIHRARVPHGWLVATGYNNVTLIFVPDENHEWLE